MNPQSKEQLQRFIAENNLKRPDGIILFLGRLSLFSQQETSHFESEIQVITLPHELVLYVMECCKPAHPCQEMYRTSAYEFIYLAPRFLEIKDRSALTRLLITPVRSL